MDSARVFVELTQQGTSNNWQMIVKYLVDMLPSLVALAGIYIAVSSQRQSKELRLAEIKHVETIKQLELQDSHLQRKFQVEFGVAEKALDAMGESYSWIHKINRAVASLGEQSTEEDYKEVWRTIQSAREYWEKHVFYLPLEARKIMIPMTNKLFAGISGHSQLGNDGLRALIDAMRQLEDAFAVLMAEYNLFNDLGSTAYRGKTENSPSSAPKVS